jgi:Aspartyl/Asparaginyl beta-hydroxylase
MTKKRTANLKLKVIPRPPQAEEPIRILTRGVLIAPLLEQLDANPQLWNQNVFRSYDPAYSSENPHERVSDIIVRFNDWKNWTGDRHAFNEQHESVWWAPYEKLTFVKPLVFDLMRWMYAEALGMVLITKIPPHHRVKRHIDSGWHARHYLKFGLSLKAAPGQRFCFDGMELETKPGDLFAFDNSKPHWVTNDTDEERWTLIMCLRLQQAVCRDCKWSGRRPDLN